MDSHEDRCARWDVRDVAAYHNVNPETHHALVHRGAPAGVKLGGAWRFYRAETHLRAGSRKDTADRATRPYPRGTVA